MGAAAATGAPAGKTTTSPPPDGIGRLVDLLAGRRFSVLTGAGCSTESGIPDYRGPETARRARNPIRFAEFVKSEDGRKRYWARSFVGWPRLASARPNAAHEALAALSARGHVRGLVTQNVDRLHRKAGSVGEVELHGALEEVVCLQCAAVSSRAELQDRLVAMNPDFEAIAAEQAPDGDAELDDVSRFEVARCLRCAGDLKPHVVFFGESVPRPRVDAARQLVDSADALLVVGSSLVVYSGFRFVKQASQRGIPVAILNLGSTRGDPLAQVTVSAPAGATLQALASALG